MTVEKYLSIYDKEPYYDVMAGLEAERRAIEEQAEKEIEENERRYIEASDKK